MTVVHKFGGSSLSSAARYHAVANIVRSKCVIGDCVVVSAAGKTTDTLVKLWQCYQNSDSQGQSDILALLKQHQFELINELLVSEKDEALAELEHELKKIAYAIDDNSLIEAELLAHGELWSARLLSQYLNQLNLSSVYRDAREIIYLNQGELDVARNHAACKTLSKNHVNVITGFIASNEIGKTVTLGRNGSDYSATLIASYIDASSVTIWTDTQGVYSTDPRKVEKAVKYNKVCREQANLLARLGNPVLHAKTLSPIKNTDIKLVVRSSYDNHSDGTEVVNPGFAKQKRFITNIDNYDVLRVESFSAKELSELSLQLQQPIHHFVEKEQDYLLVSALLSSRLCDLLQGRANIVATDVSGIAVVCEIGAEQPLLQKSLRTLESQSIVPRFTFAAPGYAIILTEQALQTDLLTILHDEVINISQELAVIVAGLGNVGGVFIEQLSCQIKRLNQLLPVRVVGLLRSKSMLLNCQGVDINNWQSDYEQYSSSLSAQQLDDFVANLDYEHKVVIDITASEAFSQLYPSFVSHDCHLISANKYAGTAAIDWYKNLRLALYEKGLLWRFNTSVGAGLPVNYSLADLQNSGDIVEKLSGVFSGTLSWLGSHYDGSKPFSELVLEAKELGYTEPDPREDLSGRDVQRKLLILARELGLELNLEDISLSPWMPAELATGTWQQFIERRNELDEYVAELAAKAKLNGQVLRYVAELDLTDSKIRAEVGLKAVNPDDAVATLKPGDNIFVINTRWYNDNAMIIQGPGAGKEVTAAGVHSDLYWLCRHLIK